MKKHLLILSFILLYASAFAQVRPFGDVDIADLNLKECPFEKDADAMVLFNQAIYRYDGLTITADMHQRLKIFKLNNSTAPLADVTFTIPNDKRLPTVENIKAATINMVNGKPQIIKLDKSTIFKRKIDKWTSQITLTFPGVQSGSILDITFTKGIISLDKIPDWSFQGQFPVRLSQCILHVPKGYTFKNIPYATQPLKINAPNEVAMENIHSLPQEPFMTGYKANLQHVSFLLTSTDGTGKAFNTSNTWSSVGAGLIFSKMYGQQLDFKLKDEESIIDSAKKLDTLKRIEFIFKKVQHVFDCDDFGDLLCGRTTAYVWQFKTGSASEINLILARLLIQSGINTALLGVSTVDDNRITPEIVNVQAMNRTVAYVKANNREYVLDASDTDNKWDVVPFEILNTYGLYMNVTKPAAGLIFIQDQTVARSVTFIQAEVLASGKMTGTAQLSSFAYNHNVVKALYDVLDEKKYIESLKDDTKGLNISSFKIENKDVDTLPLMQNFNFEFELPGSDENYIYITPNLFSNFSKNPFISKMRTSDINMVFRNNYNISGIYKLPAGYKVIALPKNLELSMPDSSIRFKRMIAEQDGQIVNNYNIAFKRSYFFSAEYPVLYDFYRRMFEMLDEPVVLKKN